jgi:hypothetical protein
MFWNSILRRTARRAPAGPNLRRANFLNLKTAVDRDLDAQKLERKWGKE